MEQLAMERIKVTYLRESIDTLALDITNGYMSINTGRDGRTYAWYADEFNSVICDVDTLELCDDADKIDDLLC
jgi:hypothetical protein